MASIVSQAGENVVKKISSGIGKNALIGTLSGSVIGAGAGGLTAMATGADEDNTKGLIVTGALAGGLAGSMVGAGSKMIRNKSASGSFFMQDAMDAAEQMAKNGGKNNAVLDGAKGVFSKVGAKAQSISDSIDDIGGNISKKLVNNKDRVLRNGVYDTLEKQGFSAIDAQELSHGIFGDSKIADDLLAYTNKANALGGAAQGAIMGSAGGALVGGIAGGIDEDESFLGGAIKGGFIGGTLGGIGGAASGYFNNSARLLSNTTSNINSLIGR